MESHPSQTPRGLNRAPAAIEAGCTEKLPSGLPKGFWESREAALAEIGQWCEDTSTCRGSFTVNLGTLRARTKYRGPKQYIRCKYWRSPYDECPPDRESEDGEGSSQCNTYPGRCKWYVILEESAKGWMVSGGFFDHSSHPFRPAPETRKRKAKPVAPESTPVRPVPSPTHSLSHGKASAKGRPQQVLFFDLAWGRAEGIREAVYHLAFVKELTLGKLPQPTFQEYLQQDTAYLRDFARALSTASAKSEDPSDQAFLSQASSTAVMVERSLHATFLTEFGVSQQYICKSPTCAAYTNFLLATAHWQPLEVLCAALLPCFALYMDVGRRILRGSNATGSNPYQRWINMYSSEDFAGTVEGMKSMCNRLAAGASPQLHASMHEAFVQSMRYEWMFFDAAYRHERWPISTGGQTAANNGRS